MGRLGMTMAGIVGGAAPAATAQSTLILSGSGNYAIPSWAKILRCQLLGAGGPAGSGRQGAAGTVRCAGGPGGNGAYVDVMFAAADLIAALGSSSLPYSVGASAAGGAAVATPDTNGNPGTTTTSALNGTYLGTMGGAMFAFARAGVAGSGGTNANGVAGSSPNGTAPTGASTSASTTGGVAVGPVNGAPGCGGGITAADVPSAGSAGGSPLWGPGAAASFGTGGVVGGASPTSGTAVTPLGMPGPPPGGGAASILAAAQAGANALPNTGCGGASGGASLNGFNSGAGGNSGSGCLVITAYG
jgi:hypothetical protein